MKYTNDKSRDKIQWKHVTDYDSDTVIDRLGMCLAKWHLARQFFKMKGLLPMGVP